MKKISLSIFTLAISFNVFSDCNVGPFNINAASNTAAPWSDFVKLNNQKITTYIQPNLDIESKAETLNYTKLPNSKIIAFEYKSVIPSNLIGSEVAGGWLLNAIRDENDVINGSLFTPYSDKNGLKLILVGLGNPIPLYQSFEDITGGENRIGIYINKQSKQIGYILNGVNKGYKWSFSSSFEDLGFTLVNGFAGFSKNSSHLGSEVVIELITDHSKLQYQYPIGTTDICGSKI